MAALAPPPPSVSRDGTPQPYGAADLIGTVPETRTVKIRSEIQAITSLGKIPMKKVKKWKAYLELGIVQHLVMKIKRGEERFYLQKLKEN